MFDIGFGLLINIFQGQQPYFQASLKSNTMAIHSKLEVLMPV